MTISGLKIVPSQYVKRVYKHGKIKRFFMRITFQNWDEMTESAVFTKDAVMVSYETYAKLEKQLKGEF